MSGYHVFQARIILTTGLWRTARCCFDLPGVYRCSALSFVAFTPGIFIFTGWSLLFSSSYVAVLLHIWIIYLYRELTLARSCARIGEHLMPGIWRIRVLVRPCCLYPVDVPTIDLHATPCLYSGLFVRTVASSS